MPYSRNIFTYLLAYLYLDLTVCDVLTELRRDGFGAQPCYECVVAEQLVDGQPSETQLLYFWYTCTSSEYLDQGHWVKVTGMKMGHMSITKFTQCICQNAEWLYFTHTSRRPQ